MTKFLFIAGHGEYGQGNFDSGAIGFIKIGEHKYYEQVIFPLMRKWVHDNDKNNLVLFSDYDVYSKGNIVELAKSYGSDTVVTELHYDSFSNSNARGGHVIVKNGFTPDKWDIGFRDGIKNLIGVRYNYKGYQGINGRDDLLNCNLCANGGVNYRLIELGFGTNQDDAHIMMNKAEDIAKMFLKVAFGRVKEKANQSTPKATQKAKVTKKSIAEIAKEVINGKWGNGQDRVNKLRASGYDYNQVQAEVNRLLNPNKKTVTQIAKEVINGKWGNGSDRVNRLNKAGYNYNEVQNKVNELLR